MSLKLKQFSLSEINPKNNSGSINNIHKKIQKFKSDVDIDKKQSKQNTNSNNLSKAKSNQNKLHTQISQTLTANLSKMFVNKNISSNRTNNNNSINTNNNLNAVKFDCTKITKYFKDIEPNLPFNKNIQFKDESFPPNEYSLLAKNKNTGEYIDTKEGESNSTFIKNNFIEWKRITDILGNDIDVFKGKIEKDDVKQGGLGNCYFLSSLAALSDRPYLIYQLFRTKKISSQGIYEVVLYIDGLWQVVFVDDYFPVDTRTGKLCFSETNGSELWVIILEKAWAKINGGYANTIGGNCGEPLYALTGFSNECLFHNDLNEFNLWEKISNAINSNNVICCSTYSNREYKNGLIDSHAYTLVNTYEINNTKRNMNLNNNNNNLPNISQIIKLRNPWGVADWKGVYSNKSEIMSKLRLKSSTSNNNNIDDEEAGIFYLTLEEFQENFQMSFICHIMYNANVKCYMIDCKEYINDPLVFNFYLEEKSKVSLSMIFESWRFNRKLKDLERPSTIVIAKYDHIGKVTYLDGNWNSIESNLEFIRVLNKGFYCVWLYIPTHIYKDDIDIPDKYVFKISSEKEVFSKLVGTDKTYLLIQKLIVDYVKYSQANSIDSCENYYQSLCESLNEAGISALVVYNKSETKILKINFIIDQKENLTLLPPYKDLEKFSNSIPPLNGIAVIGVRTCYKKAEFSYKSKQKLHDYNLDYEKSDLSEFLSLDIPEDDDEVVKTFTYTFSSEARAVRELNFDCWEIHANKDDKNGKDISNGIEKDNNLKVNINDYEEYDYADLRIDNEHILGLLDILPITKAEENDLINKQVFWTKKNLSNCVYYGLIDKSTLEFKHRGGVVFDNKEKIIGYWTNNTLQGHGKHYDNEDSLIYEGNYQNGRRNGYGVLYFTNGNYYEGYFNEDRLHGKGIYYWKNKQHWEGRFINNNKNGIGLMINNENKPIEIIEFKNDNPILRKRITKQMESLLIKEQENINNNINSSYNKDKHSNRISSIEEDILRNIIIEDSKLNKNKITTNTISMFYVLDYYKNTCNSCKVKDKNTITFKFTDAEINNTEINNKFLARNNTIYAKNSYYIQKNEDLYFDLETDLSNEGFNKLSNNSSRYSNKDNINNKENNNNNDINYEFNRKKLINFVRNKDEFACELFNNVFEEEKNKLKIEYNSLLDNNINTKNINNELIKKIKSTLESKEKPNLQFIPLDIGFYFGEVNEREIFNGVGVLYRNKYHETYSVGNFKDGVIQGYAETYNQMRDLIYKGMFEDSFYNGKGEFHFDNDDYYIGDFVNNYKHGKGIYYWSDGSCWDGKFHYDNFKGEGKYYYKKSPFTQIVVYDNNEIIEKREIVNDNSISQEQVNKLNYLKEKYEEIIERLLLLKPVLNNHQLIWDEIINDDGTCYIGQIDINGLYHGRGCYIEASKKLKIIETSKQSSDTINKSNNKETNNEKNDNSKENIKKSNLKILKTINLNEFKKNEVKINKQDIKYYIGYWNKGIKHNFGYYYNNKFQKIYEGEFKEDDIHGRGRYYYLNNNSYYDGEFNNNQKHGYGIYNWEKYRWEGIFKDDKLHGTGSFIYKDYKLSEIIEYNQGNIIKKISVTVNSDKQKRLEKLKQINELKTEREYIMELLMKLSPTVDDVCLNWCEIKLKQGTYIGQVNSLNKPQGRGCLYYHTGGRYFIGYWQNELKEGYGCIYSGDNSKLYEGNFSFNEPKGRGRYYLEETGEFYEGVFDNLGNGEGVFFWLNGCYWKGRFSYHMLDGKGKYYDSKDIFIKEISYVNGELVKDATNNKENIYDNDKKDLKDNNKNNENNTIKNDLGEKGNGNTNSINEKERRE